jgi:hypothetical protein
MKTHGRIAAVIAALIVLASCGQSTTVPTSPSRSSETVTQSGATGTFVQYALPAGVNPSDLARGPYGTLWFTPHLDLNQPTPPPARILQLVTATGTVHTFNVPSPPDVRFINWVPSVISAGRAVFFLIANASGENTVSFTRITPEGAISEFGDVADSPYSNFAVGPDGNIWYTNCPPEGGNCDVNSDLNSRTTLGAPGPGGAGLDPLIPSAVAAGPGGNISVAGFRNTDPGTTCPDCGAVDVFSTSGTKLNEFRLPTGSNPVGIVTGSDHNLWVTERGINKIARVTPLGVVTQFSIPTANAGLDRITSGWDGALWFTESTANKIGRITTTGSVTEYTIPLANAFPTGIVTCASTSCPPHGGVWFTETNANKIGKFIAP